MAKALLLQGLGWNSATVAIRQGCALARFLIVATSIGPAGMGAFAIAASVLAAVSIVGTLGFRQLYIGRVLTTNTGEDDTLLHTVWLGQLGLSIIITCLTLPVGLFAETLLQQPGTMWLTAALATSFTVSTLANPVLLRAERSGQFQRIAVLESCCQIAGIAAAIAWTIASPSPWALVIGQAFCSLFLVIGSYVVFDAPGSAQFDKELFRRMISMGRPFMVIGLGTFVTYNLDKLLIAGFGDAKEVGTYFMAQRIAELPSMLFTMAVARSMLPRYTQSYHQHGHSQLLRDVRFALRWTMFFFIAIISLFIIAFTSKLYNWFPDKWMPAMTLLPILLIAVGVRASCNIIAPALITIHRSHIAAKLKIQESAIYLGVLPFCVYGFGGTGAAIAMSVVYSWSMLRRYRAIKTMPISPAIL